MRPTRLVPCPKCGGKGQLRRADPAWLRAQRLRHKVGLRAFAKRLGVSAAYLCDVEYGRRGCPKALLDGYLALGR